MADRYRWSRSPETDIAVPSAPPLSSGIDDYAHYPGLSVNLDNVPSSNIPTTGLGDSSLLQHESLCKENFLQAKKYNGESFKNKDQNNYEADKQIKVTPPPDAIDEEPEPSAPPIELMDRVNGYESASFDAIDVPPPSTSSAPTVDDKPHRDPLPCGYQISEHEARQALLMDVSSHCCYGNGTARNMAITKIEHSSAFHYTLESFTEKRQTSWTFEPYTGGLVDGPSQGSAPTPWELFVAPPADFQNSQTQIEVPHTASLKTCHMCGGIGRKRCSTCTGNGWEYCYSCHGDGQKPTLQGERERCFQCHGTGRRRCWKCNGDGLAVCRACSGTGQIKCFIQLSVTWTNHIDDHIVEKAAAVADDRIRSVTGEVIFQEQLPQLWPINHFPDTAVNMASVQLIQKHASLLSMEKLLFQRQRVRIVPVATICYEWKNHEGVFYVYGFEQKVYIPDYPQTCCWGCNIL